VAGLIYLRFKKSEQWTSPWKNPLVCCLVSLLGYSFVIVVPWVPPEAGYDPSYSYYLFPLIAISILCLGALYWLWQTKLWAWVKGYKLVAERSVDEDGAEIIVYGKVPLRSD